MTIWQLILIPIGLMILGLVHQILILRGNLLRLRLVEGFLSKFIAWCNGEAEDYSLYNCMLSKAETVQTMLAGGGLIDFRPPFTNYTHRNYPVILNETPEIQKDFFDDLRTFNSIARQNLAARIQMVDGCLHRLIGSTEEQYRRERTRLLNPLVLFCGGVARLMERVLSARVHEMILAAGYSQLVPVDSA